MTLLIACLLIHGLQLNPWLYIVAVGVRLMRLGMKGD
jgi:hypothetical protein